MMESLVLWYLKKRHGVVYAIKPPLGISPYRSAGRLERMAYRIRKAIWRWESGLHDRYGQSIRDEWLAARNGQTR